MAKIINRRYDLAGKSFSRIKQTVLEHLKKLRPDLPVSSFDRHLYVYIRTYLLNLDGDTDICFFLDRDFLFDWLREIEELKSKTDLELKYLLEWLSYPKTTLPFTPVFNVGGKFYFNCTTYLKFPMNQILYDHYISDKIFNTKRVEKTSNSNHYHVTREKTFNEEIQNLFSSLTPYCGTNIKYVGKELDDSLKYLRGEIDTIAYFKEENILIVIQVKLSNVSPRSQKKRYEWREEHITKVYEQVGKDRKLLQVDAGLKFIAKKLGTDSEISSPYIYPLIVTDNFFVDHKTFGDNDLKVKCISFFELKHLILNQKVDERQVEWPTIKNDKAAKNLISAIESNTFWSFLDMDAKNFNYKNVLSAIHPKWAMELTI